MKIFFVILFSIISSITFSQKSDFATAVSMGYYTSNWFHDNGMFVTYNHNRFSYRIHGAYSDKMYISHSVILRKNKEQGYGLGGNIYYNLFTVDKAVNYSNKLSLMYIYRHLEGTNFYDGFENYEIKFDGIYNSHEIIFGYNHCLKIQRFEFSLTPQLCFLSHELYGYDIIELQDKNNIEITPNEKVIIPSKGRIRFRFEATLGYAVFKN